MINESIIPGAQPCFRSLLFLFLLSLLLSFLCLQIIYLLIWLCWHVGSSIFVAARGIIRTLSCSVWDLVLWPGMEPGPPALEAQREPPGKSAAWKEFLGLWTDFSARNSKLRIQKNLLIFPKGTREIVYSSYTLFPPSRETAAPGEGTKSVCWTLLDSVDAMISKTPEALPWWRAHSNGEDRQRDKNRWDTVCNRNNC